MALQTHDLWSLVLEGTQIDPLDLAEAVVNQADEETLDYRTRMMIHDSVDALESYWGKAKADRWLQECPHSEKINSIRGEEFDKVGFPSLKRRIVDKTKPETVRQFFEHLGQRLHKPVRVYVAGSIALILPGYLSRRTEDIDVVDEVPDSIRQDHALLESLENSYSLKLGHVQSHYFAKGWQDRAHSLAPFGKLEVFLLDVYDVFLSKLFSRRLKDIEDMRVVESQLEKDILAEKLKTHCKGFLTTPDLLQIAQNNWKILFGEDLPS